MRCTNTCVLRQRLQLSPSDSASPPPMPIIDLIEDQGSRQNRLLFRSPAPTEAASSTVTSAPAARRDISPQDGNIMQRFSGSPHWLAIGLHLVQPISGPLAEILARHLKIENRVLMARFIGLQPQRVFFADGSPPPHRTAVSSLQRRETTKHPARAFAFKHHQSGLGYPPQPTCASLRTQAITSFNVCHYSASHRSSAASRSSSLPAPGAGMNIAAKSSTRDRHPHDRLRRGQCVTLLKRIVPRQFFQMLQRRAERSRGRQNSPTRKTLSCALIARCGFCMSFSDYKARVLGLKLNVLVAARTRCTDRSPCSEIARRSDIRQTILLSRLQLLQLVGRGSPSGKCSATPAVFKPAKTIQQTTLAAPDDKKPSVSPATAPAQSYGARGRRTQLSPADVDENRLCRSPPISRPRKI